MRIYSLMLSSTDTACHNDVRTKDGTFGSCVISSSELMAFDALTAIEYSVEFNPVIRSAIVFLKFLGVNVVKLSTSGVKGYIIYNFDNLFYFTHIIIK